jgi:hypothetical protein
LEFFERIDSGVVSSEINRMFRQTSTVRTLVKEDEPGDGGSNLYDRSIVDRMAGKNACAPNS